MLSPWPTTTTTGLGEPPEGRYTRDRAEPDFWRNQWQAIVATSLLGIFVILAVVFLLIVA